MSILKVANHDQQSSRTSNDRYMGDRIININYLPALGGRKQKHIKKMHKQISDLKKENQQLKDILQDVSMGIIGKNPLNYGLTEQEIIAKVNAVTKGVKYNASDWDMTCKNGEQGR